MTGLAACLPIASWQATRSGYTAPDVSQNVSETKEESETEGASVSQSESDGPGGEEPESPRAEEAPAEQGIAEAEPDPLATALEESKRLRDQLLRTAADFDNFRKRSRREVTEAAERGREDLLKELLPVFDNLERAADHAKSATDVAALADGIDLVIKQFVDTLSKVGVTKVEAVGQPFDPALHEAIQHLETQEVPAGTVAHQVQAGYKMGERLVRPCMVVVAKGPNVTS